MACNLTRTLLCKKIPSINEHFNGFSYLCRAKFLCRTIPQKIIHSQDHMVHHVYPISFCSKNFSTSKFNDDVGKGNLQKNENEKDDMKKLTLFQKFKKMYRDYWYVLVPVHLVTSAAWFGSFYYMAKR